MKNINALDVVKVVMRFYLGPFYPPSWDEYLESLFSSKRRIGISIIGMQRAGKTLLYDKIREEDRSKNGSTSIVETLDSKIINIGNKEIELKPTKDITGDKEGMCHFEELYNSCDIMIVVFDIYNFLYDKEYRLDFAQRMKAILTKNKKIKRQIILLGSHLDKVKELQENQILKRILEYATNEKYTALKEYVKNQGLIILGNLTDDNWVENFKNEYLFFKILRK